MDFHDDDTGHLTMIMLDDAPTLFFKYLCIYDFNA